MNETKERLTWPDWVKGIGILSIVMAHVIQYFPGSSLCRDLNKVLCSYHVPVFFIWSGISAALWPGKYNVSKHEFYTKRARRYLIPYIFFSLFNSLLKLGVLLITDKLTIEILRAELTALLITGNGTVWFLVTLFFTEALFYETKEISPVRIVLMFLGLIFSFVLYSKTAVPPIPLLFIRIGLAFAYFMFGFLFWSCYAGRMGKKASGVYLAGGISMIILGCFLAHRFQYQLGFFSGIFANGCFAVPVSLLFSVGIILCCYSLRDHNSDFLKGIQFFGKESMLIMLLHPTILLFFTYPFGNWFRSIQGINAFALSMTVFIIVATLNLPFVSLISRRFPVLKGESNANR